MKTNNAPIKLIVLLSALASLVIATSIGQESPPPIIREYIVLTNPGIHLAATSLRITFEGVTLHPITGKPLLAINLEAWAEEEDEGVTNNVVIRRQTMTMTTAQLNAWQSSSDGFLFLKNAMLNRANLTERVE